MKKFTASSGASVQVGVAGFRDAIQLKNAMMREIANAGIELKDISITKMDIGQVINAFLLVESSPSVYEALWPCLGRSLYNGQKITEATFEDEKSRQDYYEILKEFLMTNATLFLPKAALQYWECAKTMLNATPKSE